MRIERCAGSRGRKRSETELVSLICLVLAAACSADNDAVQGRQQPTPATRFVRFTQPRVFIDKLEEPVLVPAETGSSLSSDTLLSESPQVVSIERGGQLKAHMNGEARIHSTLDGRSFIAEVRATRTLWISPGEVELLPAQSVPVRLTGDAGLLIDPEAVVWMTSDPSLVRVERGRIVGGSHSGRGHLVATYGGARAEALVTVRAPERNSLAFRSAPKLLRQGEVVRFELSERVDAKWTLSRPKVLASLAPGLFQGKSRGRTEVCASTPSAQRICTVVEVTK